MPVKYECRTELRGQFRKSYQEMRQNFVTNLRRVNLLGGSNMTGTSFAYKHYALDCGLAA